MALVSGHLENLPHYGQYPVGLIDPPWNFKTWSKKGQKKSPQRHYPCQTIEDICAMPIGKVFGPNAVIFLWGTWPTLFKYIPPVLDAWGFTYSGLAWEWIKYNPESGKYAFGTGYGTRKNLEPCILARRGKPILNSKSERDFIFERRREHSRKPDEQYRRIMRMYDGPYVELFSRASWQDWDAWGNEVGKFD